MEKGQDGRFLCSQEKALENESSVVRSKALSPPTLELLACKVTPRQYLIPLLTGRINNASSIPPAGPVEGPPLLGNSECKQSKVGEHITFFLQLDGEKPNGGKLLFILSLTIQFLLKS